VKKLLFVLVLIGCGLAGLAYWLTQPATRAVTPGIFTYAQVDHGPMVESISATGSLHPQEILVVSSQVPGLVIDVPGEINAVVPEGAVLARLDPRTLELKAEEARDGIVTAQAAVAQAEAAHSAAQLAVKYQRDISKGGFRSELEQAQAKLKAAEAGVEVARARLQAAKTVEREARLALDMAVIKVPARPAGASGEARQYLVIEKKVQRGQLVGPTAPLPLFTLAGDLRHMEVHAEVAEGDVGPVRKGLKANFTVSAYREPEVKFVGTVKERRPIPANVKGAIFFTTVIDVENQKDPVTGEWMLQPGMTAAVDVITGEKANVWKVPSAALNFSLEEAYQSPAARTRLAAWRQRSDWDDWRPIWVWDAARNGPWPVFIRIADQKAGKTGLKDGTYNEILEWESGTEPAAGGEGPRVIISAPPAHRPGFFDQPANIKVS
jgi:HlyD family secretion protein